MIIILNPLQGGGNIIENIKFKKRIYADINKELIAFFKALQDGWEMPKPYSFDREHYNEVRQSWKNQDGKYPDYYYGYVSLMPTFSGKIWGSFANDNIHNGCLRKYWLRHQENVEKQWDKIKDCDFICSDYRNLDIKNALIYCDPPYKNSKQDYYNTNFNYDNYYNWCKEQSKNNKIFMSECEMPNDFKPIWQKEYSRTFGSISNKIKTIEKLYTI